MIDVRYHCVCVEQTDFAPILFEDVIKRIEEEGGKIGFKMAMVQQCKEIAMPMYESTVRTPEGKRKIVCMPKIYKKHDNCWNNVTVLGMFLHSTYDS
jgi:hypothetical protein